MNNDQKTTVTGIIKMLAIMLSLIGINVAPESQILIMEAGGVVYGIATAVQAYFTNK